MKNFLDEANYYMVGENACFTIILLAQQALEGSTYFVILKSMTRKNFSHDLCGEGEVIG